MFLEVVEQELINDASKLVLYVVKADSLAVFGRGADHDADGGPDREAEDLGGEPEGNPGGRAVIEFGREGTVGGFTEDLFELPCIEFSNLTPPHTE